MIDKKRTVQYQENSYQFLKILSEWDISFKKAHPEIAISGSPQRCNYRIVIEDDTDQFYILENILKTKITQKQMIAQTLSYLSNHNISEINPYLKNSQGFITKIDTTFWQIQPYVKGVELNRPEYVFDAWRGEKLADFLINLWKNTEDISENISLPFFSLKDYVLNMIKNMSNYHPIELEQIESVYEYLTSDFFLIYDQIPLRFCHGDYHPLNIIWDYDSIRAVIDWEFLGLKIEIYDMANLLGCIGIEEPTSLSQDFVIEFIKNIKQSDYISKKSFLYLFDCTIALRFAWLAEWLRCNDGDMIQLEIDYMNLLFENRYEIKRKWALL
jgi:homoserine kinase type II